MREFAIQNPGSTLVIIFVLAWVASRPFWLLQLWIRARNIRAHGWPPAHLDADGDRHSRSENE
jgi:hypothetical protein